MLVKEDTGKVMLNVRRQANIWSNADLLPIGPLGTDFSEMSIYICYWYDTDLILDKCRDPSLKNDGHFIQGTFLLI